MGQMSCSAAPNQREPGTGGALLDLTRSVLLCPMSRPLPALTCLHAVLNPPPFVSAYVLASDKPAVKR